MARRQPLPALGATALDHEPTGPRAHALAETMGLRTTPVVRLKCSFHWSSPY